MHLSEPYLQLNSTASVPAGTMTLLGALQTQLPPRLRQGQRVKAVKDAQCLCDGYWPGLTSPCKFGWDGAPWPSLCVCVPRGSTLPGIQQILPTGPVSLGLSAASMSEPDKTQLPEPRLVVSSGYSPQAQVNCVAPPLLNPPL